jgi:hypothetical protein
MKSFALIAAAAALALAATPAAAAYIYTPSAGYQTAEGNGNNIVFFPNQSSHLQWRYDSSIFGSAPLLINGFSFRFDTIYAGAMNGTGTFNQGAAFSVKVATLDGALSTTFADNLDGAVTVMSGARNLPYLTGAPAGQTKPFGVHFAFTAPYLYDPTAGDLIVDMFTTAQANWGTFDFVTNHPLQNRVFSTNSGALTGAIQALGPVTRFDVSPAPVASVPEPAAWALMIGGFGMAGAVLRRRRAALA